jgi:DNA polymerase-4
MPGFKARQLCPEGIFLPSDMARYAAVSRQVREVFEEFTSEIEPLALDEAFLDITGSLRLFDGPQRLARRLKGRVRQRVSLTVSVGVAPSKLVAKIACTLGKPDGLKVVAPNGVQQLLDPLGVRRLWGVGPVVAKRLNELNIVTLKDLRLYDSEWLRRLLGDHADELQARARGEDARSVVSERLPKSYGEENTFETDVYERSEVASALTAHSEAVARRLRRDGFVGKTVTLRVKFAERTVGAVETAAMLYPLTTRQRTLGEPSDDGARIRAVVLGLWDELEGARGVRLVGVSVSGLVQRSQRQLDLFSDDGRQAELGPTLDAIEARFGSQAIRRGAEKPDKLTPSGRIKAGDKGS